jgi:hypothetical protein
MQVTQSGNPAHSAQQRLLVGWAARDIVPPKPVMLRGQFYVRVSKGVADPITATALAVESTQSAGAGLMNQALIISCDLAAVGDDLMNAVRQLVAPATGLDPQAILISATHTHTASNFREDIYPLQGPEVMAGDECLEFTARRVADAAIEAWNSRAPGGISHGYGHVVVGHNRRAAYAGGVARMYGKTDDPTFEGFEGYEDHGLDVLFTFDQAGRLTGIVPNITCPSQISEHGWEISADFWHEARTEIRARLGQNLFILPQCAPAGDQSPHLLIHKNLENEMWRRKGLTQRQEIGRRIAAAVEDVLSASAATELIDTHAVIRHHIELLPLPVRMVTDEEHAHALAEIERLQVDEKMPADQRFVHLRRNKWVTQRYEEQKTRSTIDIELHVLRIGNVAMATDPFELFLDYGLRIKARSRAAQTFLAQLACGSFGYLPTERAVQGASYGAEVASNQIGPAGGQILVDRTVEIIAKLFA